MGQLLSSEEEFAKAKAAIGSLLYHAMSENGALPDLSIAHPPLLANGWEQDDSLDPRACLQQLRSDMGNRAPTYLKDLIGRLSSFSDEPRLAGLVGLVVTMVMDMIYLSSRRSSGAKGKSIGSSCEQRVWELQEAMEEYLKRCRINLADHSRLRQDTDRLEAQVSLTLTQLKTCLLGGGCTSRSLRQWASGAVFHTQMLVHLAGLEGQPEPLAARAALKQYQEDLAQIIPAYRCYKSGTVCVVKCRGGLPGSGDSAREEEQAGLMTGLTVTDRETGRSATIPLSAMERETENMQAAKGPDNTSVFSSANLNLITSDQYAQAYLDHMFSDVGPVAELKNYFMKERDNLSMLRTHPGSTSDRMEQKEVAEGNDGEQERGSYGRENDKEKKKESTEIERCEARGESLKLSIVETAHAENGNRSSNQEHDSQLLNNKFSDP